MSGAGAARLLGALLCCLALAARADEGPDRAGAPRTEAAAVADGAGAQGGPAPSATAPEAPDPAVALLKRAQEGSALVRKGQVEPGLARLRDAVREGEAAGLPASDQADLHYALGLALLRAGRPEEGAAALRRAAALSPSDGEIQLDLATALRRAEDPDGSEAAAREALRLGLRGEDRQAAEEALREARSQRLHQRLTIDASVSLGFDSNVLQGVRETIGDRFTGGARSLTKSARRAAIRAAIADDIINQYNIPTAPRQEQDLPLSLYLDVAGRVAGGPRASLWLEYHFAQTFMTLPLPATAEDQQAAKDSGVPYDPYEAHDVYTLQEHRATLRLRARPRPWLQLGARAEGFANFSGLRQFTPFQGGLTGAIEGTARESAMLQTRLSLTHQYRAAFDRSVTPVGDLSAICQQSVTDSDTIFDGNKTDLALSQELRLRWLRARLGYQFHSDRSGVLEIDQPYYYQPMPTVLMPNPQEIVVGCYNYRAPLSYYGQEVLASGRLLLPKGLEVLLQGRYEYRAYDGLYGASFHRLRPTVGDVRLGYLPRRDHRVVADVTLHAELPRGLALELAYSYTKNLSSIANGIDNRSYDKHVASLWALYSF